MDYKCKICGRTEGKIITCREMLFGTRDEFQYFECAYCGCLQITEIPKDLAKYYPVSEYYSFQKTDKKCGRLRSVLHRLLLYGYINNLLPANLHYIRSLKWAKLLKNERKTSTILDVGCGGGTLLRNMHSGGFKNLTGIDLFIEQDIERDNIRILKTDIANYPARANANPQLPSKFSLIMMHHSFEHMDNPHEVMQQCYKLLAPDGRMIIRIPVCDCYAYRKYGSNSYQIDAPRHLFLHTVRSMFILAEQSGFSIKHINYESGIGQFLHSEKYSMNISMFESYNVSAKRKKTMEVQAKILNRLHDGDCACFVLVKSGK